VFQIVVPSGEPPIEQAGSASWVGVAWVGGELVAVGPLPKQSAAMRLLGLAETHTGVERVSVAELVPPEDAAARLAAGRPTARSAGGVLRAVPRDTKERS